MPTQTIKELEEKHQNLLRMKERLEVIRNNKENPGFAETIDLLSKELEIPRYEVEDFFWSLMDSNISVDAKFNMQVQGEIMVSRPKEPQVLCIEPELWLSL